MTRASMVGFVFSAIVWAQDQPPQPSGADRLAPQSRAAEIELERQAKAAGLQPEKPPEIERVLNWVKEDRIVERLTGGVNGIRVRLGGLIPHSGFAIGPEYYRPNLLHGQLRFRASMRGSTHHFWLSDLEANFPQLADGHVFTDFYAVHRYNPRIDYYGPGPNSSKSGRSDYLLEDTAFQAMAGVKPFEHLRLGAMGRYLLVNVGPGRDERFASTDALFTEATTPGIQVQSDFLQGGGFIQYDSRDYPGEPRHGGNYFAQYSTFDDLERGRFSFNRLDVEAQQYFSFFNGRRVIALRGRVAATDPHADQQVPFYLQPTLGGSEDLRGFRPFRFYDNNSLVMNAEYRWEVFSGLDMALFVDAGRVFHDWDHVDFTKVERDYGFGFRFNVRNNVFMRIDTGFSREGFQVWVKFDNVF